MEVSLSVHICQCLEGLVCNISHLLVRESTFFLLKLVDIAIEVLKDEVELIIFFDEFEQLYYVGVMQFGEDAHFIESYTLIPILVLALHALDGNNLSRLFVESFGHTAKAAISQFITYLILLHSNYNHSRQHQSKYSYS